MVSPGGKVAVIFNSFVFLLFLLVVYSSYLLLLRRLKAQNILLLVASYVFYGYWDWRFLSLLVISTCIDFIAGNQIARTENPARRKLFLVVSMSSNLLLLGFFKYFNFFAENAVHVLRLAGLPADPVTLRIVLPVGISFYTFQSMTYAIDIYRRQMPPARRFLDFALYVAFFPQLMAGPIERASKLLPQMESPRRIRSEQVNAALFLILWGYFKKIVIADNLARIANGMFNNYTAYSGLDTVVGILAFAFQIYCDFSGYSDIARGLAKMMGFELMVNFNLPYFALDPSDFWRRWHISLSTWLRDNLYIPLGGNRKGTLFTYRNLLLTMLLGGLWHGASWTFIIWGAFHGSILVAQRLLARIPPLFHPRSSPVRLSILLGRMALMFALTLVGWVIFRCQSVDQILGILGRVGLATSGNTFKMAFPLIFFVTPLLLVQVLQHWSGDLLIITKWKFLPRMATYALLMTWIFVFGVRESMEFIYFQF